MSPPFGALVTIESHLDTPSELPTAHAKSFPAPSPLELDDLEFGARYNAVSGTQTGTQTPITPATPGTLGEFLISRPPTPQQGHAVPVVARPFADRGRLLAIDSWSRRAPPTGTIM